MPSVWVTRRNGETKAVECRSGKSLMLGLKTSGIGEIAAICGGCASCGTCHVYVADAWLDRLPPMQSDEDTILAFSDWRQPNSRLSCQIQVIDRLDGLAVTVASED
ncbi:MAG: 2Fe-2S iron-sulfur cluster binding domain-containing protein [Sphingomonas sp.]|nr:2Fe-2S iron-sulfur cluster binding domain-containing protein [Sphingomonas sp.]